MSVLAVTGASLLAGCDEGGGGGATPAEQQLALVASDVERAGAPDSAVAGAVAGVHHLGAGLYGRLAGQAGNLAISPFSVAVALGLTVAGAQGRTASEMLAVLGAPDLDTLDTGLNALTSYVEGLAGPAENVFEKPAEIALESANGLFGQAGEDWEQPFLDRLARDFGAGMQTVDWSGATEAARQAVNDWTAKRTNDRIVDLLPEQSVTPDTRLVLVNALYFKAPWFEPFEEGLTQDGPFHLDGGSIAAVPMMRAGGVPALVGEGFSGARLAYAGGELAMSVLLPVGGGLGALEQRVAAGGLAAMLEATSDELADLTMPRWTFRTRAELKPPLSALGMPTAFTDAADFGGMTRETALEIGEVYHQVFVAVDEEGTEAAAATAVVMTPTSAAPPARQVVLDRPFLFVVHDVEHGTPLFLGRVADPRG